MDNVVFYGEGGDATRRQVRSAAAAHSHRVGPRKPKVSKRRARDESLTPIKKTGSSGGGHPQTTSTTSRPADATIAANATPTAAGATVASGARGVDRLGTNTPVQDAETMTSRRRLPQYSWTEYPRYGLGGNVAPAPGIAGHAAVGRDAPTVPRPTLPPLRPALRGEMEAGGISVTTPSSTAYRPGIVNPCPALRAAATNEVDPPDIEAWRATDMPQYHHSNEPSTPTPPSAARYPPANATDFIRRDFRRYTGNYFQNCA